MASTSRSEADTMIEEFIRLQEAQVTLLKRMFGSSPAAATTPTERAEGDPGKETSAVTRGFMHGGQDGMAVSSVASMEEAGEISEEEFEASSVKDPLEGMHLHEVSEDHYPWESALHRGDCKSLMAQLRDDRSLMMRTLNGRTVLHVASIYGCEPLVDLVLENSKWNSDIRYPFHEQPSETGVDAVCVAVDEETKLTAADIITYFVGKMYTKRSLSLPDSPEIQLALGLLADCKKRLQEHQCSTRSTPCTPDREQLVKLIRADINRVLLEDTNSQLLGDFNDNPCYNFACEQVEFTFHSACDKLRWPFDTIPIHYVERVMGCLKTDGGEKLRCLLELQDWCGNPPFHRVLPEIQEVDCMIRTLKRFFPNLLQVFINASDNRGWTFLHKCAAMGYHEVVETLVEEESIDVNPTLPDSDATPLHLAILHNHSQVVKSFLSAKKELLVNAIFERNIVYGDKDKFGNKRTKDQWTPLQLAVLMGRVDVVRELLTKVEEIHDLGKKKNKEVLDHEVSALHMAAASGIPEVLRLFLNDGTFNPLKLTRKEKRSALHFAIDTTTPCLDVTEVIELEEKTNLTFMYAHPVLKITDFASLNHHTQAIEDCKNNNTTNPKSHWRSKEEYGGKMACITMLLQAGVDVWQQDADKNYA